MPELTKKEVLDIWRALSHLETAYSIGIAQENKRDGVEWSYVERANEVLEKAILED